MDPPNSVSNSHYYCYSQAQLMAWLAPGDDESSLEPMPAQIQRRIAVLGVTPSLRWNLWKRLLRVSLYLSFEQTHLSFGSHACTPSRMHTHTQTARQTQTDTHTHKQICTYVYIYIYMEPVETTSSGQCILYIYLRPNPNPATYRRAGGDAQPTLEPVETAAAG